MENKRVINVNVVSPWTVKNNKAIAPVTLIKQGVLCGSAGCILWSSDILKANAGKWEGVPVVINHPTVNGQFVSVNQVPNAAIGKVTKTSFDSFKKAITGYIEIDINHYQLSNIQNLKEVSVGVFSEEKEEAGTYYNKNYQKRATNMTPDHLALLSGDVGACSWEDGCGIRVNQYMSESWLNRVGNDFQNLINNDVMDEFVMPPSVYGQEKVTKPECCNIDVQKWDEYMNENELVPPMEIQLALYHKRQQRNQQETENNGDDEQEFVMPIY